MSHEASSDRIDTYHCICSTLIIATSNDLTLLPRRTETIDNALIFPLQPTDSGISITSTSALHNTLVDKKPLVIKREDGFEKRILLRCGRCDLVVGYKLDEAHFSNLDSKSRVAYILPGALVSTEDMMAKQAPEAPPWAQEV